ncbi:MAG TPA: hypothetical protein VJR89_17415 [Polyangiales bacterium]|nr:hypothetical protein [Polyangiales bacterium]
MENRISYAGGMSQVTRRSQWVLLILAAANGGFLYLLPGYAESGYAWAIKPSINAAFMGAGYLAGLLAAVLGIYHARRWRSVRALLWPFLGLGVVMTLATVLHQDRFRWGYSLTWLWTLVYIGIPPAAFALWQREERTPRAPAEEDSGVDSMRALATGLGSALLLLSALLFFAPKLAASFWPWQITPLIARVFAGWHLLMGGILIWVARGARRFHELPIPFSTVGSWSLLLCALPIIHWNSLTRAGSALLWLVFQFTLLVFCAAVTTRAMRAMRCTGQGL